MSCEDSSLAICIRQPANLGSSGEIVFSTKLGFLETRSDVDGIMADIRSKVSYGGSVRSPSLRPIRTMR